MGIIYDMAMTKREFNNMRDKAVILLFAQGYQQIAIAKLLHMSRQRVCQIIKNKFDKKKKVV
jgi:DNA-binding transcriptional regulator LsrR (DeoR family)